MNPIIFNPSQNKSFHTHKKTPLIMYLPPDAPYSPSIETRTPFLHFPPPDINSSSTPVRFQILPQHSPVPLGLPPPQGRKIILPVHTHTLV